MSAVWDEAPLEEGLAIQAEQTDGWTPIRCLWWTTRLCRRRGLIRLAWCRQYASALGKTANLLRRCVLLTLARDEVPVMIGLRLFLPDSWASRRRADDKGWRARRPSRASRVRSLRLLLAEIDRVRAAGCALLRLVLADARVWSVRAVP